jgi:hypothetical protein
MRKMLPKFIYIKDRYVNINTITEVYTVRNKGYPYGSYSNIYYLNYKFNNLPEDTNYITTDHQDKESADLELAKVLGVSIDG